MGATIYRTQEGSETWNNTGNVTSCEIKYFVQGATTQEEAMQLVFNESPLTTGNAKRNSIRFDGFDSEQNAEVSVSYSTGSASSSDDDDDEEATMSFDCGGGTRHVTHGLELVKSIPGETLTTPHPGVLIGWNGKTGEESEVAGVDVPCAQLRETYTKVMRLSAITTSFKRKVASMVGKINSSSFKGWQEGEVMFLGCSYSAPQKGNDKIVVSFNFAIQMTETNIKVGNEYIGKVEGWQYVWTITSPDPRKHKACIAGIYITDVVEKVNFKGLGL